jgi:hypothetical protein
VFWPLTQALIDTFGWREAVEILAAINVALCLPLHVWAQRVVPIESVPGTVAANGAASVGDDTVQRALRTPAFYLLCGAFMANALAFSAMSVHLLPMLADKGLTPLQAAAIGAMAGPMQVLGRVAEMAVGSRFKAVHVGLVAMAMLPLSLLLFAGLSSAMAPYLVFAFLYGAGNGVVTIVRGAIPAEVFGYASYGAINGAMAAPVLIAKAGGPFFAAMLWTALGGYEALAIVLAAVAALSVVLATPIAALARGQ